MNPMRDTVATVVAELIHRIESDTFTLEAVIHSFRGWQLTIKAQRLLVELDANPMNVAAWDDLIEELYR